MNLSDGDALLPFSLVNPANGLSISGTARIDTGADITVVNPDLVASINAVATGSIQIVGVTGTTTTESAYTLDINLGESGYISGVNMVTDSSLSSAIEVDMIIGVDVLHTGIFDYDGQTGTYTLNVGLPGQPVSTIPTWAALTGLGIVVVGVIGVIVLTGYEAREIEQAYSAGIKATMGRY